MSESKEKEEKFPYVVNGYEVLSRVGGGSYGSVYLCKNKKEKKDKKVMCDSFELSK